jgi:hypothetical protein
MSEMENILRRHSLSRDVKNAKHPHLAAEEFKEAKDAKKLKDFAMKELAPERFTERNFKKLLLENSIAKSEKEKLEAQKNSPWKSFFYSQSEKQSFVQSALDEFGILYRETDNGFEAQEFFAEQIRKIEKEYRPKVNSQSEKLRADIDKFLMQSENFEQFLSLLKKAGYEIKEGKYLAVKPKFSERFIRIKSLGQEYSEQALRNRLTFKKEYENKLDAKISEAKNPDSLETQTLHTQKHYIIVFAAGVLPVKRKNLKKPFAWTNDKEIEKLAALNNLFSGGATLESLKNKFSALENTADEKAKAVLNLQKEQEFFRKLFAYAKTLFENPTAKNEDREKARSFLSGQKISVTKENYPRLQKLIDDTQTEIAEKKNELSKAAAELRSAAELYSLAEKIAGGTYVQSLVNSEKEIRQAKFVQNGLKNA